MKQHHPKELNPSRIIVGAERDAGHGSAGLPRLLWIEPPEIPGKSQSRVTQLMNDTRRK